MTRAAYYPNCLATLLCVFDGLGGTDSDPIQIHVVPRQASVNLNSYKEADTFQMDFDLKKFPISPELIKSMAVSIWMFGMNSMTDDPRDYARDDTNLVMTGLVDDAQISYSSGGRSFQVSGRDYTSLMLDKRWTDNRRIPVGKTLQDTVQQLVTEATTRVVNGIRVGHELQVEVIDPNDPKGSYESILGKQSALTLSGKQHLSAKGKATTPFVGAGHSKLNKKGIPVSGGNNNSYWDVIYRLCVDHGYVVFVQGLKVIVTEPHVLTKATIGEAVELAVGQNVSTVNIERHLGKETVPQIVVRSYDPKTKKNIEGKWPAKGAKRQTGIGTETEEVRVYPARGVTDVKQLTAMAKARYHALSRTESRVRFTTRNLTDLQERNLLSLRPGQPVRMGFDLVNLEELRSTPGLIPGRLLELGYSKEVAQIIGEKFEVLSFLNTPLYVKDLNFSWSLSNGIDIDGEAVNFVNVKDDVQ